MAGLVKVKEEVISGAVSTLNLDNAFTDTFDAYMITGVSIGSDTNSVTLRMRFIKDDGSVDTNTSYATSCINIADFSTTINRLESNGENQFFLSRISMGTGTDEYSNIVIYCFNTRLSEHTNYIVENTTLDPNADLKFERGQGYHTQNEKIRGLQFFSSSGNLNNGKFTVYGYSKL